MKVTLRFWYHGMTLNYIQTSHQSGTHSMPSTLL